jgi:hypothetical protein
MRKRTTIALLAVAVAAVAVGTAYLVFRPSSPSSRINPTAYARIKEGMTLEEVTAAVGLPPGNYRTREPDLDENFCGLYEQARWGEEAWFFAPRPEGSVCERWIGDDHLIQAEFGPEGGCRSCLLLESRWVSSWPLFDRVKTWVGFAP